ncbi:MAG: shikimate dehydrogenase [Chloroflexi bacterium]|nr:shikimate dehydrogenase [Chloroflexota bacterium]
MTATVGIIGSPLRHSISPIFQQAAFDFLGLDIRYEVWETARERLSGRVQELRAPGVLGANVTVPHKEAVVPLLDRLAESASRLGAVNTIVRSNGLLVGHNTDASGFLRALREDGGLEPGSKRVLVLGAGGAARAVAIALAEAGVASITIANRTVGRATRLASGLAGGVAARAVPLEAGTLAALREAQGPWDLIVNCTTVGMRHGPAEGHSPLATGLIPAQALVYDLVYNPPETPLLRQARKTGARTLGGLPMLVYQGAESFRLWTGREPPLAVMLEAARRALEEAEGRLS